MLLHLTPLAASVWRTPTACAAAATAVSLLTPALVSCSLLSAFQMGKRGATKNMPLPDAPKEEELKDNVPKSLKRLIAIKKVLRPCPAVVT